MLDNLYENIGGKIKNWAKWIFIVEAIGSVITAIALPIASGDPDDFILISLLIAIVGPIVAYVGSWILYAFGELVEKTCNNENNTRQILLKLSEVSMEEAIKFVETASDMPRTEKAEQPATSNVYKATQCECGELHYARYCPVCGKKANASTSNTPKTLNVEAEPQPKSTVCKCGERFYGDICPNCGRSVAVIQKPTGTDGSRKATQCDCGELHYARYCPVCGKKADTSTSNSKTHLKVEDKPQHKSTICQCGERFYGNICPNCGRKVKDI